ncbi:uncharacterized protein LOC134232939 isoform X2 [Saccostrea cucullata]|uniref:uncharacterized protein LOC134232939 isoform X2 n=1 Tax=Saccostrea cuccullata TaxID=36930 RepID=UPI002ED554C2
MTDSSAYTLSTDSFNLTSLPPNSTSYLQTGISLLIALVVIFVIFFFFYPKKSCLSWSTTVKSTEKNIIRIQRQDRNEEEVQMCDIDNELDPIQTEKKQKTSVKIENESVKREHGSKEYDLNCEPEMTERTVIEECTTVKSTHRTLSVYKDKARTRNRLKLVALIMNLFQYESRNIRQD